MKDLNYLKLALRQFAAERDWDQFHSPKNLSMALAVEASELMEHFQWLTEDESSALDEETFKLVRDEIADVQVYLIRIADKLEIDLVDAVDQKMIKNKQKYPVEKVKGSAKKYTAYQVSDEG